MYLEDTNLLELRNKLETEVMNIFNENNLKYDKFIFYQIAMTELIGQNQYLDAYAYRINNLRFEFRKRLLILLFEWYFTKLFKDIYKFTLYKNMNDNMYLTIKTENKDRFILPVYDDHNYYFSIERKHNEIWKTNKSMIDNKYHKNKNVEAILVNNCINFFSIGYHYITSYNFVRSIEYVEVNDKIYTIKNNNLLTVYTPKNSSLNDDIEEINYFNKTDIRKIFTFDRLLEDKYIFYS